MSLPRPPIAYRASLSDLADGDGPDVRLLPGDVVFVEDKPLEDFGEVVSGLLAPFATLVTTSLVTTLILLQQN